MSTTSPSQTPTAKKEGFYEFILRTAPDEATDDRTYDAESAVKFFNAEKLGAPEVIEEDGKKVVFPRLVLQYTYEHPEGGRLVSIHIATRHASRKPAKPLLSIPKATAKLIEATNTSCGEF